MSARAPRRFILVASVLLVAVAAAAVVLIRLDRGRSGAPADATASRMAGQFLADWSDPDGRVIRRDQGGDTVSEGQAYGMLLAVVAHDRTRFDTIWNWTRTHMQQADGLLAWRWADGRLADEQSAADADVDAAWALSRAAMTFGSNGYADDSRRISGAILAGETVPTGTGRVLVAGPWARTAPMTVNPSYLVAGTATALAASSGDQAWQQVSDSTRTLDRTVVGPSQLPPDWARLPADSGPGSVQPAGTPDGSAGAEYGLDAPRLLIRLAASCDPGDRGLAASAAPVVGPAGAPAIRSLAGPGQVGWQHPISDVAVAAVDSASGNADAAGASLAAAAALQARYPTYYGAAWVALGQAMLTTDLLGTCARTAA